MVEVSSQPEIVIAISVLNDGINNIKLSGEYKYCIIHQVTNGKCYSSNVDRIKAEYDVRYVFLNIPGLSISRNLAVDESICDYIWIMDDDVEIFEDSKYRIDELIQKYPSVDAFILNHSTDKTQRFCSKKIRNLNYLSAASVSSIDILLKRSSIVENDIRFDERFGLGTELPSGEEYIFITDMLKKGLTILQTNIVVSYHPPVTSGQDFYSTPNKINAKKEMFKRVFSGGFMFRLFLTLFIIKKSFVLIKNKKLMMYIQYLLSK